MSNDSDASGDRTPEAEFAVLINKVMAKGIQDDADPDVMAKLCINTARELYDYYGAGEEYSQFMEFVVSAGFEAAEIEQWLDEVEGRSWQENSRVSESDRE